MRFIPPSAKHSHVPTRRRRYDLVPRQRCKERTLYQRRKKVKRSLLLWGWMTVF